MADLRRRAYGLIAPARADPDEPPWDGVPALVAASLVMVPVMSVPVMGFGVIATSNHGIGWGIIAGFLATMASWASPHSSSGWRRL